MNKQLLILGAGVDRTAGIDFPLANTLFADVTRCLDGLGKGVDAALREMLPGLRFSFNSMIARAVDKIATREPHEQKAMFQRLQDAIAHLTTEQGAVRKHGESNTLKMGLSAERHEVAAALGADMLNIETLLIEKFLGFYNDKPADIKNYIYIAWALWAYLVAKQKEVLAAHVDAKLPFYGLIPKHIRTITLNYTAFLKQSLGDAQTIYFYGGLGDYVRMDTRDLLPVDEILKCDPAQFIQDVVAPNVDVGHKDIRQQRHVILTDGLT